jgi:predicted SprT family Zn-dependent metalloprotease
MPLKQESFEALKQYIPNGSFELLMPLITEHKVHLVVTRERQTKLGDYRNAHRGKNHRITVNGNLNNFAFLITLIHELAHLLTFEQFGNRVQPHGREWKVIYGKLLKDFLDTHIFPADIEHELKNILHNPAASSCAEDGLMRVLRRYDPHKKHLHLVEELGIGERFVIKGGRLFERREQLRKRIRCIEIISGKIYLFSPLYEVKKIDLLT